MKNALRQYRKAFKSDFKPIAIIITALGQVFILRPDEAGLTASIFAEAT